MPLIRDRVERLDMQRALSRKIASDRATPIASASSSGRDERLEIGAPRTTAPVTAVALTPDGKRVLIGEGHYYDQGGNGARLRLFDVERGDDL